MDQLKLKLQEYYNRFKEKGKPARGKAEMGDLEQDILSQFGLPASKRFVQILHDFVQSGNMNEQLIDNVSQKLRTAARKYLLAPAMTDIDQLVLAKDQKKSPYDVLPEIGIPVNEYALFLLSELLYKRNVPAKDILDEMKKIQQHQCWEEIVLLSKLQDHTEHVLYAKLRKFKLIFVDDFVQFCHKKKTKSSARPSLAKSPASLDAGYQPNFQLISKLQVEDVIFDDKALPTIIGKIRVGTKLTRISLVLDFSQLSQVLAAGNTLGAEINTAIKKKLSVKDVPQPLVVDLKAEFGQILKIDSCYMEIYKPQFLDGKKWIEEKEPIFFVERILSKREYDKRVKEEEIKENIQECLELVGASYVHYQRLKRLGISDEEAKLRAGLQDELLFQLSFYLNKLKD